MAVGLFAHPRLTDGTRSAAGLFVGGNGRLLGVQLLGAAVVLAWTGAVALVAYKLIDRLPGCQLRVDKDAELLGLDFAYHDGFAYPELNKEAVAHFNEVKAAERRVKARNAGVKATRRQVKVRSVASSKGSSKGSVKSSKRKGVSILVRKGTKTMCKDGPNSDEERSMSCSVSSYTQQGLLGSSVSMSPMTTGSKMDYSNKTVLSERNAKLTKAGSSSRTLAEIAPKSTGPQGGEVSDHALFGNKAVQSPHGLQDDVFKSSVLGKGEARELALRELTDNRGTSRRWGEKGASSSRGATARNRVVVEDVDDREGEEGGVSSPSGSPAARSREQPLGKQ
uniref:Ammonium transporter AmtB-like domain-containing protein n=1 Tax=Heterosigma akashiwo TaxID=2829 RepID=A0A7S3Y1D1_HETAK